MADPPESHGDQLLQHRADFVRSYFRKGNDFIEEVLRENERLRFRVAELQEQVAAASRSLTTEATLKELVQRIHALETEREELLRRFGAAEAENREYQTRYAQIEQENNLLANLYVASYQLHSTLDLDKVIRIASDILTNFIGAKKFALLFLDDDMRSLRAALVEGMPAVAPQPMGRGVIGNVAERGEPFFANTSPEPGEPPMCIPIRNQDKTLGAIAIWELLPHKEALLDVDHELFKLLSSHVASALEAAALARGEKSSPLRFSVIEALIHRDQT